MKFFGRQNSLRKPAGAEIEASNGEPPAPHRLTLELQRAQTFAGMLARSRSSQLVEVSDLLAGMYICNWDRISQYWDEYNVEEVESVLRAICRISPQRWHSWIELYDRQLHGSERERWQILRHLKARPSAAAPLRASEALLAVLRQAGQIAPVYDRSGGRSIPILTTECVLLCIVRNLGSQISRKLAMAGLDLSRLEREALLPQRPPRA